MGTWFIRPKDLSDPIPAYATDDYGRQTIKRLLEASGKWERCQEEEIDEIFIDGGGAIRKDEPRVSCGIESGRFATFVRHLPFALGALREAKEHDRASGCVVLSGFHRKYILSLRTRDLLVKEFEVLLERTEELGKDLERKHAESFAGNPHINYAGKCSCQSGKPYRECCGKE